METKQNLLIALPSDDELFEAFMDAIKNGVHENIKGIASKLGGFIGNAKDDIKGLLNVDPEFGLYLDITIEKGDQILSSFVGKQSRLMKNTLKVLLSTVGASTFTNFVNKMKQAPEDIEITANTLSKIMHIFFLNLGKKYLINETEISVKEKINNLFV